VASLEKKGKWTPKNFTTGERDDKEATPRNEVKSLGKKYFGDGKKRGTTELGRRAIEGRKVFEGKERTRKKKKKKKNQGGLL